MTVADLFRAIKRHWILEIILFVVTVGAVAGFTFTATPMYSAQIQLMPKATASADASTAQSSSAAAQLANYIEVVQSDAVLQPTIDNLGLHETVPQLRKLVVAENVTGTTLLDITVTYPNAKDTTLILNEVAKQLNKQVSADASDMLTLTTVQKPVEPTLPSSPNIIANMAIGVVAALVVAVLGAFLRELADNNIHAQTDITNAVNAPILASIPKSFTVAGHVPAVIVKPRGHAAEEFRRLCTNLSFVENGNEDRPDNDHSNVIIVTSAVPDEGKTSVSVNLAAVYAEKGESVLLIDADARHPSVAKALGLNNAVGLVKLLAGDVDARTAVQRYWKPEMQVLPVEETSTSNVILGSNVMRDMVDQATRHYDHVIIDTAPIQVSNDASVFARSGGTVLLVVSQNVGQKKALRNTVRELKVAHVRIGGVAFNRVAHERSRKGNYYYYESRKSRIAVRRPRRVTHHRIPLPVMPAVGVVQRPMVVDYTWRIERTDCAE